VWACSVCHRKIERGEIKIRAKDIWDYTSLVVKRSNAWRFGRAERSVSTEEKGEVPF